MAGMGLGPMVVGQRAKHEGNRSVEQVPKASNSLAVRKIAQGE